MPEVSIIVPVYKAENYLRQCVDSILSQTFSDIEVFLVDDGSPDNSGQLCEEYAEKDSRVRVIHQENQGQAAARNHALPLTTGRWLCYVDSDDAVHPQMVELLYEAVMASGAGISICPMVRSLQLPEDFLRQRRGGFECLPMDEETLVRLYDAGEYPGWEACAKLIRRDLVEGYPFREGRVYEDNEAVCRWVCGAGTLARVPEAMYYYRTNPVSTTQQRFSRKKRDYLWALESIIRHYHGIGFSAMASRFCQLFVEETAGQYCRFREMKERALVREVRRSLRTVRRLVPLTKAQKEHLLDVFHPRLVRFYWPLEGALRTLRESGPGGLLGKLKKRFGKERGQ